GDYMFLCPMDAHTDLTPKKAVSQLISSTSQPCSQPIAVTAQAPGACHRYRPDPARLAEPVAACPAGIQAATRLVHGRHASRRLVGPPQALVDIEKNRVYNVCAANRGYWHTDASGLGAGQIGEGYGLDLERSRRMAPGLYLEHAPVMRGFCHRGGPAHPGAGR